MAQIQQTFTYALPTELYVAGISTVGIGTYTYVGPDTFTVEIDGQGRIIMVNPTDPDLSPERKKTINANSASELPVAYLAVNHAYEDNFNWVDEYEDETLSNGEVYKKQTNPDLDDAYDTPRWDVQTGTWKIDQLLKPLRNDAYDEARARKDYIETYTSQFDFGTDINTKITNYLAALDTFIGNNPDHKTWKFVTLPDASGTMPKIPVEIQIELNKVSMNGVGGLV